jgi:hypothetical protein
MTLMANFQLISSSVKELTPELAAQFRDLVPSPTERDLNPSRLKMLRQKAEAGLLITFHWAKAKMGGTWLRVNGQHSANVLADLNGEFPKGLKVHLDEYEVDSPQGLALLFRQFDDRKSGRSSADVSGAYQNLEPALRDVAKPIAKLGAEAVNWYCKTVEHTPYKQGDEQYHLFNDSGLHGYLVWLHSIFSIKTPELKVKEVLGAMYATFNANEGEARKFWDSVARGGVEYEDDAPASVLDVWLKDIKEKKLDNKNGKKVPQGGELYQGCVYAFNAYREGKKIDRIKYDTSKAFMTPHED